MTMSANYLRKLGNFLGEIQDVCNRHKMYFVPRAHESIIDAVPVTKDSGEAQRVVSVEYNTDMNCIVFDTHTLETVTTEVEDGPNV